MRRRFAAAIAVTALLLAAGCAESSPAAPRTATGTALTGSLRVQASGGAGELRALDAVVEAFRAAHPGLTVELVGVSEQGDHIAKLTAGFAAGNPADVFLLNYRRVGTFLAKRVVDPARTAQLALDDLYPLPREAFTAGGVLQCLPQNVSSSVVYVNPTLFRAAGVALPGLDWSWDDVRATARSLHAKGVKAIAFEASTRTVAPFVWSAGGEYVDALLDPTRVTLGSAGARAALTLLDELQAAGFDARQRAASDPQDAFGAGSVAMLVDSRRAVPAFRKAGVSFDVRPLPKGSAGSVSLLASDGWCVSKASKSRDAAHAFAAFTLGPVGGKVLAESGRSVPVSRTLAASPAFLDPGRAPKSSQVFLDSISGLRRLPNVARQNEAEKATDGLLEQFFAGRLGLDLLIPAVERATAAVYAKRT